MSESKEVIVTEERDRPEKSFSVFLEYLITGWKDYGAWREAKERKEEEIAAQKKASREAKKKKLAAQKAYREAKKETKKA